MDFSLSYLGNLVIQDFTGTKLWITSGQRVNLLSREYQLESDWGATCGAWRIESIPHQANDTPGSYPINLSCTLF